jgi:hypothetical protein
VSGQPGQPTLVVGFANHAAGNAELRTYEHIDAIHRQRFQRQLEIDRRQYDDFIGFAKQLFDALHLQTILVGTPPELDREVTSSSRSRTRPTPAAAVGIALFVAAIAATAMGVWALVHPR